MSCPRQADVYDAYEVPRGDLRTTYTRSAPYSSHLTAVTFHAAPTRRGDSPGDSCATGGHEDPATSCQGFLRRISRAAKVTSQAETRDLIADAMVRGSRGDVAACDVDVDIDGDRANPQAERCVLFLACDFHPDSARPREFRGRDVVRRVALVRLTSVFPYGGWKLAETRNAFHFASNR